MTRQWLVSLSIAMLLGTTALPSRADIMLFSDDFESGNLNQWIGNPAHHGQIVADPLDGTNHVLSFSSVAFGGDIFSATPLSFSGPRRFVLSFDFLGLTAGGVTENGGFIGIATSVAGTPDTRFWLGATFAPELNALPTGVVLTADGAWHHYEIDITDLVLTRGIVAASLMLEDFAGGGSVAGDAFFDNVQMTAKLDLTVFDQLVPCAGPVSGGRWKNHGQRVSTMDKLADAYVAAGLITSEEADTIVSTAARSDCGK